MIFSDSVQAEIRMCGSTFAVCVNSHTCNPPPRAVARPVGSRAEWAENSE